MSIVRERDYWQAKRDIEYYEERITRTLPYAENAVKDFESHYWMDLIILYENSLAEAKSIVAEHDGANVRPSDVERPANEASLDQWVSV
jgi:hypothetical protein